MVRMRKTNRRRGVVVVEAAIIFPILILLTLGGIKFGWLFLKAQQITNAARTGARIAILPDVTVADDVEPAIHSLMTSAGMGGSGYTVTVTPNPSTVVSGGAVTVRITVPAANVNIMPLPGFSDDWNLQGSVTMAKEGP
ncbi:MAG: TadE/TadG family type IV pilus assembly protein [Planctomycetota bacterium]